MSKRCRITKKRGLKGNNVSHSKRRTRRKQEVNLKTKKFWIPEEKRFVRLRVSTSVLRTIAKKGITATLKQYAEVKD